LPGDHLNTTIRVAFLLGITHGICHSSPPNISTGDFSEALAALLGKGAAGPGLSPATVAPLKDGWIDEHDAGKNAICRRNATSTFWGDGIHLQARREDEKQSILVLIGATPEGPKSSSASPTARAKVRGIGAICCST
jgi:hypothetical protein